MTRDTIIALLGTLKTAYPHFYKNLSKTETIEVIELWSEMFAEDDPIIVTEAVKSLMCSLVYPPTIADVKGKIYQLTKKDELPEAEAWKMLHKAICNSGYNEVEEWKKLPDTIKSITTPRQIHDWGQIEVDDVNTVVQSNFLRMYRSEVENKKEYEMLPKSAKEMQKKINEMCEIKQIGG